MVAVGQPIMFMFALSRASPSSTPLTIPSAVATGWGSQGGRARPASATIAWRGEPGGSGAASRGVGGRAGKGDPPPRVGQTLAQARDQARRQQLVGVAEL